MTEPKAKVACLAQKHDPFPRICSKLRDHVGPHSWEEGLPDAETCREMYVDWSKDLERRRLDRAENPPVFIQGNDCDALPTRPTATPDLIRLAKKARRMGDICTDDLAAWAIDLVRDLSRCDLAQAEPRPDIAREFYEWLGRVSPHVIIEAAAATDPPVSDEAIGGMQVAIGVIYNALEGRVHPSRQAEPRPAAHQCPRCGCPVGRDGDMCVPCFIGAGEPLPVAEPAPASSRLLEAADMMSKILEEAESKHFHQFFCNGVHAPGGMCEGEKWASEAVEELREAIAAEREPEEARQAADVMRELLIEARDERDDLKRQLAEAKEHADGALSLMRAKEAEAAMATKRAEKAEAALECETDNIAAILDNSDVGGQPHDLHDRIEFMCAKAADTEKAEAAGDAKGLNAKLLALREWVGLVDDNVAVNRWLLRGKIDYLLAEPAEEPAAEDRGDDGFEEWRKYQQGYADPKPAYVKAINELIRRAVGGGGR